jgi:hypothetical protein
MNIRSSAPRSQNGLCSITSECLSMFSLKYRSVVLLVSIPDGLEIINLSASVLMAIAFVPYGIQIIAKAL